MSKLSFHSFLFSFILLLLITNPVSAQNEPAAVKPLDGDERCWGMNFMWQKDFTAGKQLIDLFNTDLADPEDERVTGFGLDWYVGPKSSISIIGSLGIGSDEQENTTGDKIEFSETEIGIKAGWNYYPLGTKIPVYWSVGPWISYVSYGNETTSTPTIGNATTTEFSASRLGFGANVSAYLKPWDDLNWEFYAGYNLGAFITPESTTTTPAGETKGPSSFHFQDCGGMVGTRFFFNSVKVQY